LNGTNEKTAICILIDVFKLILRLGNGMKLSLLLTNFAIQIGNTSMASFEASLDVRNRIREVRNASRYDLDKLIEFAQLFAEREFEHFSARLRNEKGLFSLSFYTSEIAERFECEIRPFKCISLAKVGRAAGIRQEQVGPMLINLISEREK
jgi:hypothetical protein